jgi:rRNA-processing protein FCF1
MLRWQQLSPICPVNEGKRKRKKDSNSRDASVAEAAWFNDFTLITSDARLKAAAEKHGIKFFSARKGNPSNTE